MGPCPCVPQTEANKLFLENLSIALNLFMSRMFSLLIAKFRKFKINFFSSEYFMVVVYGMNKH